MNTIIYSFILLALVFGVRGIRNRELFGKRAETLDQLVPFGKKRADRELFGKRAQSSWFGRESRRGRELFGKRSGGALVDGLFDYGDVESTSKVTAPSSDYINANPEQDYNNADNSMAIRKRRGRELLGKRSADQTYELSNDQFESLMSAIRRDRRARGHELLG